MKQSNLREKVIHDFGEQWHLFQENEGYYGSSELLEDIIEPLLPLTNLKGKVVADVGSGAGRLVPHLVKAGAKKVIAVEPSRAFDVLKRYTEDIADRIEYLQCEGSKWRYPDVDIVLSIGVIHHIPDPLPVLTNCFENLKKGGKILIWVYGREGNELYLRLISPVRKVTTALPDYFLKTISLALVPVLSLYCFLCRYLPLPMKWYMRSIIAKLDWGSRHLTIFDQLNPAFSKYYTRAEAEELLRKAGFKNVKSYHRHNYSWTVMGEK